MRDVLVGSSVLAAFIGGAVALFAPCCISVMLPAYFASSFQRRRALLSMTFVFALGVATVILPIAFGATAVTRLIVDHHTPVFLTGAVLMLSMGVALVAGWAPKLPMPGMQARSDRGPVAVFAVGAVSGVASACCAPVLAGVMALSSAAASFGASLAVGVAYVFGMVVPLFVLAVLWDRYDWGSSVMLRGRTLRPKLFGRRWEVHSSALVSGLVLVVMGLLVAVLAFSGPAMSESGWQVTLSARLQHYGAVARSWFDGLPGWVVLAGLVVALGWLVRRAVHQQVELAADDPDDGDSGHPDPAGRGVDGLEPSGAVDPGSVVPDPGDDEHGAPTPIVSTVQAEVSARSGGAG